MALTYRGPGPWGAGSGVNLTSFQFDDNTWTLASLIQGLIDNPPIAVEVESVSQIGSQFWLNMSDATQRGPLTIPAPAVGAAPWRRVTTPNYSPVLSDAGRMLHCETGCTVLLPTNFYGDGAEIHARQQSASQIVFQADSGGSVEAPTGDDTRTSRQGAVATAKWDDVLNKWYLFGDLAPVSA